MLVNLKTIGLAAACALAISPAATRAQTAPKPAGAAPTLVATTFSTPLKIVGLDGHFTVMPRGSSTVWSCAEGVPTEIDAGNPPAVVYTLSADGNVMVAATNGATLKLDLVKGQFATAPAGTPIDGAPMHDFTTLGTGTTLVGTSPTAVTTGFALLYSAAVGLTASVQTKSRLLGVFTANGPKWQIGIFPQDEEQSVADATGATPPPKAKGDVIVTGGACKGSPVQSTALAK